MMQESAPNSARSRAAAHFAYSFFIITSLQATVLTITTARLVLDTGQKPLLIHLFYSDCSCSPEWPLLSFLSIKSLHFLPDSAQDSSLQNYPQITITKKNFPLQMVITYWENGHIFKYNEQTQ